MKKKGMLVSGFVVVALAAGFLAYRTIAANQTNGTSDVQTATIERGPLTSTLGASGNTRSSQSATIVWQTSGKVEDVTLQPGDLVQEDQLLAALDPNTLSSEMITARQDLIAAQQNLDDLMNSTLQQAQALQAVVDAQEALDSLRLVAAEDNSQAQLTLAEAQEALNEAQRNREKMDYPHSTDELVIEKAETDYLLAKKEYKQALDDFEQVAGKRLTDPERVMALNRLVTAEQNMNAKLATYNWYLLGYTDAEIAQADGELAVAQANLEAAQAEWDRLQGGASERGASEVGASEGGTSTGGATEAAVALAEATLADAQREYERVKDGPSEEDLEAAQAAVDAAQAALDHAQLLAPFAGTITEVDVKTGDLVGSGDAAFRIDDLSGIYVDLEISEVDLASVAVGKQATIEFDAIADKEYSGEVTEVGMIGTVSNGVVNYPVTVRLTDADEDIRPGMTASVNIIVDQREDVLLVPNKAIRTSGGQKTVTVLFEGQEITVPITVGLVGDAFSEVISEQLREGDVVVVNGSASSTTSSSNQGFKEFNGPIIIEGGPAGGMP